MRTNKFDGAIRLAAGAMLLAALLAGCAKRPLAAESPPLPAAPAASASTEPGLESMHAATPSAKMSVAADLRYSFDSEASTNQPAMLHLAAVPRVTGAKLQISVQQTAGLQLAPGTVRLQKVNASDVYRQDVAVTKLAAATAELRVLVISESAEGSGFGYFTIPLGGIPLGAAPREGTNAQKQDSVKLP